MSLLGLALTPCVLILGMLLPHLPGRHDPLAIPISAAATALSFGGLLLVPVGVAWLALGRGHALARAALILATPVVAVAALLTAAVGSIAGAVMLLAAGLALVRHMWRQVGAARATGTALACAVPIALIVVPLLTVAARLALVAPAAIMSRERSIFNASRIIGDIERFRVRTGAYPIALNSVASDYDTGVIGIERYGYEPSGESFTLYFEAVPTDFATQEIVTYNPRGEQDFSAHDADLLQLSFDDIRRQRGHFRSHDLPERGWKRFLFD